MTAGKDSFTGSEIDGAVSRLWFNGEQLWRKGYGWPNVHDEMSDIIYMDDWSFGSWDSLAVGWSNNSQSGVADGWITRLDYYGHPVWSKLIGGTNPDVLYGVSRTSDDTFLATGYMQRLGDENCWLLELNEDGDVLWERYYSSGAGVQERCRFVSEVEDPSQPGSKAILLVGTREVQQDKDVWVMKLESDGTPIWQRAVGGPLGDRSTAAVQLLDEENQPAGYLVGGITNNAPDTSLDSALVFHIDEEGEYGGAVTLWGGAGFEEGEIHSMVRRSDGTIVFSGFSSTPNNGDGWMFAMDPVGEDPVPWSRAYGTWHSPEILYGVETHGDYGTDVVAVGNGYMDETNSTIAVAAGADGRIPGCSKMLHRPAEMKPLSSVEMYEPEPFNNDLFGSQRDAFVRPEETTHMWKEPQKLCPMDCLVHVDAQSQASGPDGDSWETAYSDLNEGILAAAADLETSTQDHCEVWTAEGVYTSYETAQTDTFQLAEDVHVYGGFPTDDPETPDSEYSEDFLGRDWETYHTILSGGDDLLERSYHVVTGADGALLDGAYVEKGLAGGELDVEKVGGGIFLDGVTTSVRNCEVRENFAVLYGGGVFSRGAESVLEHVDLLDNGYDDEVGFWTWFGGGVFSMDSSVSIRQCDLVGNRAEFFGGGVYSYMTDPAVSAPEVLDSAFTGNEALAGAAIMTHNQGTASDPWAAPLHVNLLIHGNQSSGFSAPDMGIDQIDGAIATYGEGAHPLFLHCTVVDNSGELATGGMSAIDSSPVVVNSIFWGNHGPGQTEEIYFEGTSNPAVYHSDVQDGWGGTGSGNIDSPPSFDEPGYSLMLSSPCIDSGLDLPFYFPWTEEYVGYDIDQQPRMVGQGFDMGCYENQDAE